MQQYYKVIDNKWGDDCPTYPLTEEGLANARSCKEHTQAFQDKFYKEEAFKVVIVKITSEEVE